MEFDELDCMTGENDDTTLRARAATFSIGSNSRTSISKSTSETCQVYLWDNTETVLEIYEECSSVRDLLQPICNNILPS